MSTHGSADVGTTGSPAPDRAANTAEPGGHVDVADVQQLTEPAIPRTRTASTWMALAAGLLFLVVMLVFIVQNSRDVTAHFFTATWTLPLSVDLLLAAVLGALVMLMVGTVRILQLRRVAKRNAAALPPNLG